MYFKAE